jgi:hypothetical protein
MFLKNNFISFLFISFILLFILLFILFLFICFNHILSIKQNPKKNKKEYFYSNAQDFCSVFGQGTPYQQSNQTSSANKNIFNCTDEDNCACAKENERCLVDPQGNNTCCNNLNCIRPKNHFGYKICSNKKDACGYFHNDYLKYIFDDQLWQSYFNKIKSFFESKQTYTTVEEEDGSTVVLNNKRKEILDFIKIKGLCGKEYTSQDIRKQLDDFFTKDQIFSGLIYGAKKTFEDIADSTETNPTNCRTANMTVNN